MKVSLRSCYMKKIGNVSSRVKIAAGLFWADYGNLGAQVRELEDAGADWIHLEMRDGRYMNFNAPGGAGCPYGNPVPYKPRD